MKTLGLKKYVWFIVAFIIALAIMLSNLFISDHTRSAMHSETEQTAKIIEKSIKSYIEQSGDNYLKDIVFEDNTKLEVKSGETKWSNIVLAMQRNIVTKSKNEPKESIGHILESSNKVINYEDFIPRDIKYVGYKIDIFSDGKVTVTPWETESECVVTIIK